MLTAFHQKKKKKKKSLQLIPDSLGFLIHFY